MVGKECQIKNSKPPLLLKKKFFWKNSWKKFKVKNPLFISFEKPKSPFEKKIKEKNKKFKIFSNKNFLPSFPRNPRFLSFQT